MVSIIIQGDSFTRGSKLLSVKNYIHILVCLDVKGDQFQYQL